MSSLMSLDVWDCNSAEFKNSIKCLIQRKIYQTYNELNELFDLLYMHIKLS